MPKSPSLVAPGLLFIGHMSNITGSPRNIKSRSKYVEVSISAQTSIKSSRYRELLSTCFLDHSSYLPSLQVLDFRREVLHINT